MPAAAIATTALVISMNAQNQALLSQKEAACGLLASTYNASNATIEQMKEYANCINFLYPQDATSLETLVLKVIIVLVLASTLLGAYLGYERWQPIFSTISGATHGLIASVGGLLATGLLFFAVKFLVS